MKIIIMTTLIFAISTAYAGTLVYTYDEGGRLSEARFQHTGGIFSYEMDAAGNIKEQITHPVPEPALMWGIGVCLLYALRRRHVVQ